MRLLLRRLIRLVRLLMHLARGVWLAMLHMPKEPPPRTEAQWRAVRWWHRRTLELLGVELHVHGRTIDGPVLFVANHVSWMDISAMLTVVDAGFIGKHELRRWPVLGLLIRRGGTIFIDRGSAGAAGGAVAEMVRRLDRGDRAAVFPEGTTSSGDEVRRFHPRLFDAALRSGAPVQPVALRYNRSSAAFTDGESFLRNMWRLLGETGLRVDVMLLPVIHPAGHDRRRLAERSRAEIAGTIRAPCAESAGAGSAPAGNRRCQQDSHEQ